MNVIYKHKETGTEFTLDHIRINQKYITKFVNLPSGRIFTYNLRDIPFSDDFEMVIENNKLDLDYYELYYLLSLIDTDSYKHCASEFKNVRRKIYDALDYIINNNLE